MVNAVRFAEGVVEEQADSLRLLIVVAACGTLIASLGNLPQILVPHPSSICGARGAGARAEPAFAEPTSSWLSASVASMVQ
jgi:hypothetical protein